MMHCFAGCRTTEIVAALGLEMRDLFADSGAIAAPQQQRIDRNVPAPDLDRIQAECRLRLESTLLNRLQSDLGVSAEALHRLGIGLTDRATLSLLRAWGQDWKDDTGWAYSFPERDGQKRIVGFSFRTVDGLKGSPKRESGCRRGLVFDPEPNTAAQTILVVEGASDVAAALTLGLAAVGRPSNASGTNDLATLLRDHEDLLVLGENDAQEGGSWPGRSGAESVSRALAERWNRPVRWALPPDGAKDLRAWLHTKVTQGLDLSDEDACRRAGQEFLAGIRSAAIAVDTRSVSSVSASPSPFPTHEALPDRSVSSVGASPGSFPTQEAPPDRSVSSVSASPGPFPESWPDPEPLPSLLPPVMPFDLELLPPMLARRAKDISERMGCPIDFVAASLLVGLSAAIGRRIAIRPKERDHWCVVVNLWGALVGSPSSLKSPAMREALHPLRELEDDAALEHKRAVATHARECDAQEARRKGLRSKLADATKRNQKNEADAIHRELVDTVDSPTPLRRRYLCRDATVEKLGELLRDNPDGLLIVRDELAGFLRPLDDPRNSGDREFYLEAWAGDGSASCDRIGRGTVDVPSNTVSLLGTIQPGPYQSLIGASLRDEGKADGLIQRFQVAVYPDPPTRWVNVDREPDREAEQYVKDLFRRLTLLKAEDLGADPDAASRHPIPFLHFAPDAQDRFDRWRLELETELLRPTDSPAFQQHLAKYRSLIPSIALILHLADGASGPVTIGALEKAIRWDVYLRSHARRLYHAAQTPGLEPAYALSRKILDGSLRDPIEKRYVHRKGWTRLTTTDDVQSGLDLLVDHDWLAIEPYEDSQNRHRTRFRINPKIREGGWGCTDRTDRTDRSSDSPILASTDLPAQQEAPRGCTDRTDRSSDSPILASTDLPAPQEMPRGCTDRTDRSSEPKAPADANDGGVLSVDPEKPDRGDDHDSNGVTP